MDFSSVLCSIIQFPAHEPDVTQWQKSQRYTLPPLLPSQGWQNVPWQRRIPKQQLPFAQLSPQPLGKQKKQLLKHWEGLLSSEELPWLLIHFHALAVSTLHSVISLTSQVHRHIYIPLSTHQWAKCNYSTLQGLRLYPHGQQMLVMFPLDYTSALTLASTPWHQKGWTSSWTIGSHLIRFRRKMKTKTTFQLCCACVVSTSHSKQCSNS